MGLRRLAGGLRAETERTDNTGLTDKELRTLKEAADILSTLATRFDGAGKERKKLLDARGAIEVKVREAMQDNFAALTSMPDQVAFVAATSEYQIKNLSTLADLRDAIKKILTSWPTAWRSSPCRAIRKRLSQMPGTSSGPYAPACKTSTPPQSADSSPAHIPSNVLGGAVDGILCRAADRSTVGISDCHERGHHRRLGRYMASSVAMLPA